MIFPQDVQRIATDSSKMSKSEIGKISLGAVLVTNVAIFLIITPYTSGWGIPMWVPLLIQLLITIVGIVLVFHVFIFKGEEKLVEYERKGSDSFSKYFFLRNVDSGEGVKVGKGVIPVYEFDNGSIMLALRFRLGANEERKALTNRRVFQEIYNVLGQAGLEVRTIIGKEEFSESEEAREFLKDMSNIEDALLSKKMLDIALGILDIADEQSNTDIITVEVRTKYNYQKYDLGSHIEKVFRILEENRTSFRTVEALYRKPLLDFFREFYGLEAIDLSLMRVRVKSSEEHFSKRYIEIYQLIDSEGKIYTNKNAEVKTVTARKLNV